MQKIQGWVEQGNTQLLITGAAGTITRRVQGSYPLATVTVYNTGTVTLSTIYNDDQTPPTPKANPFTSGSDGSWFFYAPSGLYDVRFSGGGIPTPFVVGGLGVISRTISDLLGEAYVSAGDFPGADAGAQMANAAASLPITGGVVDARCFTGDQTITQNIFASATGPVRVLLGFATYILSAEQVFTPSSSFIGAGRGATIIKAAPSYTGVSALKLADSCEVHALTLQGRHNDMAPSFGLGILGADNATKILIEDNEIFNWDNSGIDLGGNVQRSIIRHNWIHNNLNEGIFVPLQCYDVLVEGNYVYLNGFNGIDSNAQNSQIKNNVVYQNGQDSTHSPAFPVDHNGIFLYPFTGDAWNHQVIGNLVYANANDGIHLSIGFTGTAAREWLIANNHSFSNGTSGSGSGIYVDGDPSGDTFLDARILDNTCYGNQKYGIGIIGSKAVNTEVRGNFLQNNIGGDYADTGTGTIYMINRTSYSNVATFPSISIGGGSTITNLQIYTPTLTPAAVPANGISYQYFTVFGLQLATDTVLDVSAIPDVGLALVHWRVAGDNSIELGWLSTWTVPVAPTGGRVYTITAIRH